MDCHQWRWCGVRVPADVPDRAEGQRERARNHQAVRADDFEPTICDHDADERAEFEEAGLQTVAANKQVVRGIQLVQQRLEDNRLFFFRGCLVRQDEKLRQAFKPCSTEEEFEVYSWARGADGALIKEQPIKENDHGLDALRYFVMSEDRDSSDPAGRDPKVLEQAVAQARRELQFNQQHSHRGAFSAAAVGGDDEQA